MIPSTPREVLYLVSPSGVPNFGDEFIARAWLDWLAVAKPDADVWLDCFEPGRAAHLFQDTHPRLRTTNTLWQLAHLGRTGDTRIDATRAEEFVRHRGTPRLDLGLELLSSVDSIHLVGGGYFNSVWPANLAVLAAVHQAKQDHGMRVFATGQGLMPADLRSLDLVTQQVTGFDYVESRDAPSARQFGVPHGVDDAFLAFQNTRPVFSRDDSPQVMLLGQGDFLTDERQAREVFEVLARFADAHAADGRVGLVEGMPPEDAVFRAELEARYAHVEFYPFVRLWQEGLPARPGQSWLSTRFHFHLLAASAGAQGVAADFSDGYYSVKHELLRQLGTGWSVLSPGSREQSLTPTAASNFPKRAASMAKRKEKVARTLYG